MGSIVQNPQLGSGASRAAVAVPAWRSPIVLWALLGTAMACFSAAVFLPWLLSADQFAAVPLTEADVMPASALKILRGVEVLSTGVMLWALYHYLAKPWLRSGTPPLAGLLLIGALITYVFDTTVNYADYHMAWNKHSFNFGAWAAYFPGHSGPTRYAEAWFWGPPMYVYFGVALASIQLKLIDGLRPHLGRWPTLALAFAAAFAFDLLAESTIIQLSQAYAWPYTIGALSVWTGTQAQFPLYESLLVAIYASLYCAVLKSARDQGESFIELGAERLPAAMRLPARLLAATGFAALCTAIYFGGFYVFSQFADSKVTLPSYLMYADAGWTPPSH